MKIYIEEFHKANCERVTYVRGQPDASECLMEKLGSEVYLRFLAKVLDLCLAKEIQKILT